jgi:hypothetical protein
MNPKKRKPLQGKSFWKTLLMKLRKILTIFFAMAIDKHLEYDQDEIDRKPKKEKKK